MTQIIDTFNHLMSTLSRSVGNFDSPTWCAVVGCLVITAYLMMKGNPVRGA
jgi:hypothetical protein